MKYKSRVIKNEFNFIIGLNIIVLSALIINLVKAFIEKVDFYEIINSLIPTIIGVIVLLLYLRKSRNAITELKRNGIVETNYYKSWYKLKKEEQKKNKKNNNTLSYLTKFLRYLKIFTNSFRRGNSFPRTVIKPK